MALIDRVYMTEALKEARRGLEAGEVPVGAVIVHRRRLLGRAHHQTRALKDPTAHAPMIAITQAASTLGDRWLKAAILYVTVKPCAMCAGAVANAGIERVVYGTGTSRLRGRAARTTGRVLEHDCASLVAAYRRRQQRKRLAWAE